MSVKLVILGFLKQKELHGYEIKQMIERDMGDWTNIAFGSIYFALSKLTKEGFIRQKETQKQDYRPSRIIYQITDQGEKEFMKLLDQAWKRHERQYFTLDMAFYFFQYYPVERIKKYLSRQLRISRLALKHLAGHEKEELSRDGVPKFAEAIFEHTVYHLKAEYRWLKEVLQNVKNGKYS